MKRTILLYVAAGAVATGALYSCVKQSAQPELTEHIVKVEPEHQISQTIPGQYIVVYNDNADPSFSNPVTKANYQASKEEMGAFTQVVLEELKIANAEILQNYSKALKGSALKMTAEDAAQLAADPRVALVEQDQIARVSMGGPPGGGGDPGQTTPWGVTRVGGAIDGSNSGTAWIIDSGIDLDHPDLNVNVGLSVSFLSGGGGADSPDDQNGHGSHCAGIVGAIDNSIGCVGVAAGAEVVAVRVLDRRGNGSYSGVIAGVDYVAANASNGDVANMSLGGPTSTALDNAVSSASSSCPFVLAAGNESTNANNSSPARVNGNNIYTVSSMTSSDSWSYFSNYGNPPVDYCAPGSSIFSCYKNGDYATMSGTSMAAPHVAGIVLIGGITTDGNVSGDPDGNPDPIAHH